MHKGFGFVGFVKQPVHLVLNEDHLQIGTRSGQGAYNCYFVNPWQLRNYIPGQMSTGS